MNQRRKEIVDRVTSDMKKIPPRMCIILHVCVWCIYMYTFAHPILKSSLVGDPDPNGLHTYFIINMCGCIHFSILNMRNLIIFDIIPGAKNELITFDILLYWMPYTIGLISASYMLEFPLFFIKYIYSYTLYIMSYSK